MSIRKRESKKSKKGYVYEVYFPYKDHGNKKIYRKSGFQTKSEAQNHEAIKKAEYAETGIIYKRCEKTLKEVYDEFLCIGSSGYQYNTIYNTQKTLSHWNGKKAVIDLGKMMIADIDYKILQEFFNLRKDCGKPVNEDIKVSLRRVFIYAIRAGYISVNPIQYVVVTGKETKKEKHVITYNEYLRILSALKAKNDFNYDAIATAIKIGYYTGMRLSEIMALQKEDIDLTNCTVFIHRKLVYKGLRKADVYAVEQMKSKKSKAVIPFPVELRNELQLWFQINPYNRVICDEDGNYFNCDSVGNQIRTIAKGLGIQFHFHLLRHTYATNLVNGDVEAKVAQELLRHANFNTTMSIYTHIEDEKKKTAVNSAFNKLLSEQEINVEKVSSSSQQKSYIS